MNTLQWKLNTLLAPTLLLCVISLFLLHAQLFSTAILTCSLLTWLPWRQISCVSACRISVWVPASSVTTWLRLARVRRLHSGRGYRFSCTLILGTLSGPCGILGFLLKTLSWPSRKCSLWFLSMWWKISGPSETQVRMKPNLRMITE